jgi:hypothetical protein
MLSSAASSEPGRRTADTIVRILTMSFVRCAVRARWMSNAPTTWSRAFSTASTARSKRSATSWKRPATQLCRVVAQLDQPGECDVVGSAAQQVLVHRVDTVLEVVRGREIARDDAVQDGRNEDRGIQLPDDGVVGQPGTELTEEVERLPVHRQDVPPAGHDAEGLPDGALGRGFDRDGPEAQVLAMKGRSRLVVVECQPANGLHRQAEALGDIVELLLRRSNEVRPDELPRRHRLHVEIGERQLPIGSVGIEHADARAPANRRRPDAPLGNRWLDQDTEVVGDWRDGL